MHSLPLNSFFFLAVSLTEYFFSLILQLSAWNLYCILYSHQLVLRVHHSSCLTDVIMIDYVTSSTTFKHAERQTKPVRRFIEKFINDWSFDFASMVAFNLLIALLPIAVILFGILGFILKDHPEAQQVLKDKIINSFPSDNTTSNASVP